MVGAGAAGLAAATTLREAGRTFVVLEARDQIGGRAHTVRLSGGQAVERGAEYLHYTASKGAVDAFTRAGSRTRWPGRASVSVRCDRVSPLTEIFEGTLGQDGANELARRAVPMGRIGRPEEIAAMVLWLCSPEASYVTAFTYDVSGGC